MPGVQLDRTLQKTTRPALNPIPFGQGLPQNGRANLQKLRMVRSCRLPGDLLSGGERTYEKRHQPTQKMIITR
jgi:hypothetical protein